MGIIHKFVQDNSRIENYPYNYKMIDLIKYTAAIMVICIHCSQLFPQEYLNFFIQNIICRIAVPFFFISSAYFVRKASAKDDHYVHIYLTKLIKSYCLWSIVFIPIGLDWIHQNLSLAGYLLPFALLYGLIHIGTYYHLWYVPAMILAIFLVDKLSKRHSYRLLFTIATGLYLFGSIESYYGLLHNGWLKDFFDFLIKIIFTTRSGLLYGMVFTLIGFYIHDHQDTLVIFLRHSTKLTLVFGFLLILEGNFLYRISSLDMNFLIMLIPFSFFFFLSILTFPCSIKFDTRKIRQLSKYYYFVHPVCIVIIEEAAHGLDIKILSSGIVRLLLIILLTHFLSSLIIQMQCPLRRSFLLLSPFIGLLITILLAGLFFQFKQTEILVKFEFVPCLWFYSSFAAYYILDRQSAKMVSQQ